MALLSILQILPLTLNFIETPAVDLVFLQNNHLDEPKLKKFSFFFKQNKRTFSALSMLSGSVKNLFIFVNY